MTEKVYTKEEVDEFIEQFVKEFYNKFGLSVVVITETDKLKMPLPILIDIANECLWKVVLREEYPRGIRTKTRKREVCLHRQIYMTIAKSWDYSLKSIGAPCGKDHATVLHAAKTVKNLLDARDRQTVNAYNCIVNAIKERLKDDEDVQSDSGEESDS